MKRKPQSGGFDFTARLKVLCVDVTHRLPEMTHIDMSRVAVSFAQTRKPVRHGLQASLTPLRFEGGALTQLQRGRRVGVQRVADADGREMLYILTFYLPRFMNLDYREKLVTVFHELWHISPEFDGDLRRHEGRCYAHTHSQAAYDAHMATLVDRWLALTPPLEVHEFLKLSFGELQRQHGHVHGTRIPRPRLIPVAE